jgi:hypothetical protein
VREKKSIKDQRGWLMLNAARRQVIVASVRWCQHSPSSASPVRPNDLAQESDFYHDHQSATAMPVTGNQNCTGVQPGRAAPPKLRRRSSTANLTRLDPSLDAAGSPAVPGGEDVALRGDLGDAPPTGLRWLLSWTARPGRRGGFRRVPSVGVGRGR